MMSSPSVVLSCLLVVLSGAAMSCAESIEVTNVRATPFSSTVVGAAGATVVGPDGALVVVPPGALTKNVTIDVSSLEGLRLPTGTRAVGPAMRLEPAGTLVLEAVTITVPVSAAMLNGRPIDDVFLIRWERDSDSFVALPTQPSADGTAVVATSDRFSDFVPVVVDSSTTSPFGRCGDGMCLGAESCSTCAIDCGTCATSSICGDGTCASAGGYTESCASCSIDCGECGATVCGDSMRVPPEECDDGNTVSNDGCSSTCRMVEPGFTCAFSYVCYVGACGDGVVQFAETCDDGNPDSGDGCGTECFSIETGYECPIPGSPCTKSP